MKHLSNDHEAVIISTTIVISNAVKWGIRLWIWWKIERNWDDNMIRISWWRESHCRTDSFKNSFFPWAIREWNKFDLAIQKSTYSVFRQYLLKVIRPQPSATFNVCNFAGLHLLTRLWLGLSHLNEHRFNHNFQDCINPLCTCSLEVESTSHIFFPALPPL